MSCNTATIVSKGLKATITAVAVAGTLTASSFAAAIDCAPQPPIAIHGPSLLLEDGFYMLLEDGGNILLE